ncbi:MAG: 4Fe-4S dicluster domain-containing protein [Vicinamibacterales bacterium]|jgi:molybdopterin-containing oxidoreductase family iron-sulfur binding subunit|nr:4Fe-4S ferredoxin [Acidobacteriota bacterium]MDP7210402.1 4Fe-4S dicluster domain-containing protein [Vicinamibacterales bacterium]HJO17243.1 4Fe-4S dicluster domain-containing protein [Vicinamibacterales bacterium]|tara:strand:+ start:481 stop:1197 length:717 start_codon:yes stop_codon:yes gene_type:complete
MAKWGMAIDIDRCDGCNACVVACRTENNVPTAGPEQAENGRAIEWIRVERHVEGEFPNVRVRFVPVMCVHCDEAPCVKVCPVSATYETPDGLNAQIHPRCIGTRACGQACPYTVRYFNWGEPSWEAPLEQTINPDVAVRWKGIMEKCTFCVQRIRRTNDQARDEEREIRDGEVKPACAQACPAQAIVFGDREDPESAVSKLSESPRAERPLEELGTGPRVVYLKEGGWGDGFRPGSND